MVYATELGASGMTVSTNDEQPADEEGPKPSDSQRIATTLMAIVIESGATVPSGSRRTTVNAVGDAIGSAVVTGVAATDAAPEPILGSNDDPIGDKVGSPIETPVTTPLTPEIGREGISIGETPTAGPPPGLDEEALAAHIERSRRALERGIAEGVQTTGRADSDFDRDGELYVDEHPQIATAPLEDGVRGSSPLSPTDDLTNAPEQRETRTQNVSASVATRPAASLSIRVIRAPPDVPPQRSAAVHPAWVDDRLTIPTAPANSDLAPDVLMAALFAARLRLERTIAALSDSPNNVDPRLIAFTRRVLTYVPTSPPDNVAVFLFGQEVVALKRRVKSAVAGGELSPDHAVDLEGVADELDGCASQFAAWREFARNARAASLTPDQLATAAIMATDLADQLETGEAEEFVDRSVPDALRALATGRELIPTPNDPTGVVNAGYDLLAADLIDSVDNVLKAASVAAVRYAAPYLSGLDEGARDRLAEVGKKDGGRIVIWVRRLLLGAVLGGGGGGLVVHAGVTFPWLQSVLTFLEHLPPP
jgi:hypothetical protein